MPSSPRSGDAAKPPVNFLTFFLLWARIMRWSVPELHVRMCLWLEECHATTRVLLVFRGAAKSTLYAVFKAWRYYRDATHRSLVWSEDTKLAKKMSRDTIAVLRRHPLCRGLLPQQVGAAEFWVAGAVDARNPSMAAYGVLSNATGSRADAVDFDDVEVPKNIRTVEAREKLRERISEATHILVPGGQETYIGTPHTHESIYTEQSQGGAAVLKIPLFQHHVRYDAANGVERLPVGFKPAADGYYVFEGIGRGARLLEPGTDYTAQDGEILLRRSVTALLDVYAGCAWPERFTRTDLARRRARTRTINAWDSQYQLEAKPVHDIRLDPERLRLYDLEPVIERVQGGVRMRLGETVLVGVTTYWDCALGRPGGNDSVFSAIFTDDKGHLYWHVADALRGDLDAQCGRIRTHVIRYQIGRVNVETNGPGGFVPPILRKHLAGTSAGVGAVQRTSAQSKNKVILDAFEPPLSSRFLWVHASVAQGPLWAQMKDWNPAVLDQPDDYLDSGAGAIRATPVRIGRLIGEPERAVPEEHWRPGEGQFEATWDAS